AAAPEFGETLFECFGDVEGGCGGFFFLRGFCGALWFWLGLDLSSGNCGALHRLEFYFAALDREQCVDAGAFRLREDAGDDLVDGVAADGAAAVQAGDGAAAGVEQAEVVVDFGGG